MRGFLFVACLLISISAWSQNKGVSSETENNSVAVKDTATFETYYYGALKEKVKGNYVKAVELLRQSLRFQPSNAEVQFELSIIYKKLKDYKRAILFGENAVSFSPNQKRYWLNIADLYSLVRDTQNASRCYAKLTELDPGFIPEYIRSLSRTGDAELALDKVNLFLKTNKTEELLVIKRDLLIANKLDEEAIVLTDSLIKAQPNNPNYYLDISELYLKADKIDKAEEYVKIGLEKVPDSSILVRQELKILLQKEDFDNAFSILNGTLKNPKFDFSEKISLVIEVVSADENNKQTSRLIESLESWLEDSHEVKIYPIIGNLYKANGDKEKALSTFRKGFDAGYTDFSGLMDMLILEQELFEYKLLAEDAGKMLKLYPNQPIILLFRGLGLNQLGELDESISALKQGVGYVMNNDKLEAEFHSLIADGYYRQNELEKCFAEYDKAIKCDAENILVLNNYSFYLSENNMHLDKALKMMEQVIEAEPNNSTYLDTMAWVYYKLGDYEKAKSVIKLALKNGGDSSSDIIEHYGDILYRLNKKNKAVRQWKKAYKLDKNSVSLKEKIEKRAIED